MKKPIFSYMSRSDFDECFKDLYAHPRGFGEGLADVMTRAGAEYCTPVMGLIGMHYLFNFPEEGLGSCYLSVTSLGAEAIIFASSLDGLAKTYERVKELDRKPKWARKSTAPTPDNSSK